MLITGQRSAMERVACFPALLCGSSIKRRALSFLRVRLTVSIVKLQIIADVGASHGRFEGGGVASTAPIAA
jgi:hypothetical protein